MIRTTSRLWIMTAVALALAATVFGAQSTNTPAIITYTDPSSTGPTLSFYSDGLGAYVDGSANVSAFFFPSGNAGLNTESSKTRTLTLDLSAPLATTATIGTPFPFNNGTVGSVTVNLSHQLLNSSGTCCQSGGLLGMANDATGLSRIGLTFPDPQGRAYIWTIKWGSGVTNSTYACNLFTSRSADGSYWTIDNIDPTSDSRHCAELDYQSTAKGKSGAAIVYGYFDLPFQFVIQKKQ